MRIRNIVALAWLALAAACQSGATPGLACTRTSDCSAPLTCAIGRCRSQCTVDRDCDVGLRCVRANGTGACTLPAEGRCSTDVCPMPLACLDGVCRNTCATDAECLAQDRCSAGACVTRDGSDAGSLDAAPDASAARPTQCSSDADCANGDVCEATFASLCRQRCTAHADCESGVCLDFGVRHACAELCEPGTDGACPLTYTCGYDTYFDDIGGGPSWTTQCRQVGIDPAGCACSDGGGAAECAPGLGCWREAPVASSCAVMCRLDQTCPSGAPCAAASPPVLIRGVGYGFCAEPATRPASCP